MIPADLPEQAAEIFVKEMLGGNLSAESTVTVCLVRLLGLIGKRSVRQAVEERVEGIIRNELRMTDRLCWCSPDTILIVAATDLAGALQLMARFREANVKFSQVAGGSLEVLWGLAVLRPEETRSALELLQEARQNLNRMIAAQ